jgi:Undecaprenyl-phosphate glucose phosphotransferase
MSTVDDMQGAHVPAVPLPRGRRTSAHRTLPWPVVGLSIAAIDLLLLSALSTLVGESYFGLVLGKVAGVRTHFELGLTTALLVVAALALRGAYGRESLAHRRPSAAPIASSLLIAMMTLLAVMFMTKSSEDYSRSVIILSFVGALPLMLILRKMEHAFIGRLARQKRIRLPHVMLVGSAERIRDRDLADQLADAGYAVACRADIDFQSDDVDFDHGIALLSSAARLVKPDIILLCMPWGETDKLRTSISVLSEHPASIHVDSDPYIGMLSGQRDNPLGYLVVGRPLSQAQLTAKRLADITLSALALIVAAPLMILAAVAIRLESPGAALFTQQRYGYNREPFRIFKFRTMRAAADSGFRQASRSDERITRVGRILRRTNIDELPQLINVLIGDMSLVGPRPHPIELDRHFTPLINRYTQRHRVRPGITGWAQVNGFRGETDTTDKMQGRIAHDLYYLSNWSFGLDLQIMLRTLLSATAYRNAR